MSITRCKANGRTSAIATSGPISFSFTANPMIRASNWCGSAHIVSLVFRAEGPPGALSQTLVILVNDKKGKRERAIALKDIFTRIWSKPLYAGPEICRSSAWWCARFRVERARELWEDLVLEQLRLLRKRKGATP